METCPVLSPSKLSLPCQLYIIAYQASTLAAQQAGQIAASVSCKHNHCLSPRKAPGRSCQAVWECTCCKVSSGGDAKWLTYFHTRLGGEPRSLNVKSSERVISVQTVGMPLAIHCCA